MCRLDISVDIVQNKSEHVHVLYTQYIFSVNCTSQQQKTLSVKFESQYEFQPAKGNAAR